MKKLIELIQRPRLQLRWKMLAGFLIVNVVLLVALVVALVVLFGTNDTLEELRVSNDRVQMVTEIELYQTQMVNRALDYVWSENLSRLNEYEIASSNLDRAVATFKPNALQQDNYNKLKLQLVGQRQVLDQIIKLDDTNQDDAVKLWRTQGSKLLAEVRETNQELVQQELQASRTQYEQTARRIDNTGWLVAWLAVAALLLAVGLAFLMTAALISPVIQLKKRLTQLAVGDLTQPVQIVNRDEFGELGSTYNATLNSLRELVIQLYTQSRQVASATEELSAQARSQVVGSSLQASAVTEATQALQELNRTAEEITRQALAANEAVAHSLVKAEAVSKLADDMVLAQERGRQTVAGTVKALYNLRDQITALEEEQQNLMAQSGIIQTVIDLIDNIAKETHLLALNASIEAAGAGVQGERFAVIAAEVKRLADRAANSTKEVRVALGGISQAVERTGERAEKSLQEAEQAVQEAGQSDKVLLELSSLSELVKSATRQIVGEIKGTSSLATNIGVATRQQQVASTQMLEKMLEIESVTSQTLSTVRQGEAVTEQLNLSARELENSANTFKLAA